MFDLLAILPGHVLDDAKRPLFFLLVGFILTFILARLNTRVTRARGGARLGAGSIVTPGGIHIHHSVFGIIGMIVFGILEFALQPGSPCDRALRPLLRLGGRAHARRVRPDPAPRGRVLDR